MHIKLNLHLNLYYNFYIFDVLKMALQSKYFLHHALVDCQVQSVLVPLVQTVQVDVTMAFTGLSKDLHILAGIFSLDILYLEEKSSLLMRNLQVIFVDILPETSKSSTFCDVGWNSNLKWLPLFSLDEAGESDGTCLMLSFHEQAQRTPFAHPEPHITPYPSAGCLHWSIHNLHILAGIFSLDILYLERKNPLLMRNIQLIFGDILPETIKSCAFWDMGWNFNLKWLPLFSPDEAADSDGTCLMLSFQY